MARQFVNILASLGEMDTHEEGSILSTRKHKMRINQCLDSIQFIITMGVRMSILQ